MASGLTKSPGFRLSGPAKDRQSTFWAFCGSRAQNGSHAIVTFGPPADSYSPLVLACPTTNQGRNHEGTKNAKGVEPEDQLPCFKGVVGYDVLPTTDYWSLALWGQVPKAGGLVNELARNLHISSCCVAACQFGGSWP
jgi:hypothetical protein